MGCSGESADSSGNSSPSTGHNTNHIDTVGYNSPNSNPTDIVGYSSPSLSPSPNPNPTDIDENPAAPTVKAFSVQCSVCMKWRLIPTKEIYEEIREDVTANPFVCSRAVAWRSDASCDNPSDLTQDESLLWVIDKPDIPVAPPGWKRLLVFRSQGSSKFADVYYRSPNGKRLRSTRDVERFLEENPEYVKAGIDTNQFSFKKPKPMDPDYVKKRSLSNEMRGCITHKKP